MGRRRSVVAAAALGLTLAVAARGGAACPRPSYAVKAAIELPPRATVYLVPYHGRGDAPSSWKESVDWSMVEWQRDELTNVYVDPSASGRSAISQVRIGDVVVGVVQLDATEGEVWLGYEDLWSDIPQWARGESVVPRRVTPSAPRPWTRVVAEAEPDDPYLRDPMLVGREEPLVTVAIEGEGVGVWSIATPRCEEHYANGSELDVEDVPVVRVPARCLDASNRLTVIARGYDGSVTHTQVDVVLPPSPRAQLRQSPCAVAGMAGALAGLAIALRRRRRPPAVALP